MTETTTNVNTLRALLERGEPVTVLDVRPAEEYAEWSIPGSLHVDAYDRLKAGDLEVVGNVDLPAGVPVVTVCGAGKTAAIATHHLRARGIPALTLDGGMKAWSLAWNTAEVPLPGSAVQVIQVRRTGKGCLSYLIGMAGEAAVIDASLAPDVYFDLAQQHGLRIRHVLDTHIHADHLSRSRRLAEASGATLHLPTQDRTSFPFTRVADGDVLELGKAQLVALRTPGHTAESTSYLLDDRGLFTGDTLFTASVGRPDLEADASGARERARMLYRSLQRVLALPPETLVLPGHSSRPADFDGVPITSTLAEARERIKILREGEDSFVETILSRIPATPPNYHEIVRLNEAGTMPDGDVTDLEAGANRCAVS